MTTTNRTLTLGKTTHTPLDGKFKVQVLAGREVEAQFWGRDRLATEAKALRYIAMELGR